MLAGPFGISDLQYKIFLKMPHKSPREDKDNVKEMPEDLGGESCTVPSVLVKNYFKFILF